MKHRYDRHRRRKTTDSSHLHRDINKYTVDGRFDQVQALVAPPISPPLAYNLLNTITSSRANQPIK